MRIKIEDDISINIHVPMRSLRSNKIYSSEKRFECWQLIERQLQKAVFAIRESRTISHNVYTKLYNLYWGF
jgi:hypothetical protein